MSQDEALGKIRIFIVDDHAMFRDGLRSLLERQEDLVVVGESGNGATALQTCLDAHPHIVLLDLNLPDMSGIEVLRALKAADATLQVVVLTMYQEDSLIGQAVHLGATGYILKDSRAADLLSGIRAVAQGRVAMDPAVATRLVALYRQSPETREAADALPAMQLTEREKRVLQLITQGLTNRKIAERLHLSEQTVKNSLSIIYQKLGVNNRAEAAIAAIRAGFIPPAM